jgi:hypothetical protein
MISRTFLALVATLGLLASCAHINPHPMDMTSAVRNAKTSADHDALAKHYEDTAKAMRAKAEEQKKMLREYNVHGYYYGRQTEDLQEHAQALARTYDNAADANMNMAKYHHRLAEDAKQ